MEKILKIIIGVILAILIFMWLSSVFKSCGSSSNDLLDETSVIEDPIDYSDDDFDDDFFEDDLESDEPDDEVVEDVIPPKDDVYEEVEVVKEEPIIEERPVIKERPTQTEPKPTTNAKSYDSKYMVLAGSYLIKSNAESMVTRLKNQGYSNAEVVVFDNSQYHSVLAARTNDYNEALQLSSQLKRKGIDNYVHTKQD